MEDNIFRPNLFTVETNNGDGTITAKIGIAPFNYYNGADYMECELDIIPEKNWEFEYAVKKNNFRAYFNDSTDIENFTLASFEIINSQGLSRWINYKLVGATPDGTVIDKNKIKYTNVSPGVDLEYVVDTARLKENIIINSPVDNFEYSFTLKLDGAILSEQEDGSIIFKDIDTDEMLWRIDSPYAKDKGDKPNGISIKRTTNVSYSLGKSIYNGVEYDAITVKLNDPDFIANAIYPIIIDPTTTDYLYADYGNDEDYYRQSWTFSSTYPTLYNYGTSGSASLLHFSGLNAYKGYPITQALFVMETNYDESNGNYPIAAKLCISDWTGDRPFNNMPARTTEVLTGYQYLFYTCTVDMTSVWNSYKGANNFYGINVYPGTGWGADTGSTLYTDLAHFNMTYTVTDTTPPANPTSVSATIASATQINLSWANPGDADYSYCKVYRDGTYIGTGSGSFADTSVGASSGHGYRVTSVDTTGNESGGTSIGYVPTVYVHRMAGITFASRVMGVLPNKIMGI